jgi:superfamily II DNA or RNA helicase
MSAASWRTGQRVTVRGHAWTVLEQRAFADCEALRLSGAGRANAHLTCTILTPFDRPVGLRPHAAIQIMRPRRWLRTIRRLGAEAQPFGGVSAAGRCAIELLAYQLEPALAMLRYGVTRVMIADAVGLGKTIQAGLILNELASRSESFRALVVAPAGLREQWSHELIARFALRSTIADAAWLARIGRELPPDVNPWVLPGIYVSSFDFVKRPEVLRPLEETLWDAVVVDEAHAAALGTARHAAVHAVARRARRVLLLTATPHAGDDARFRALCAIGASTTSGDPNTSESIGSGNTVEDVAQAAGEDRLLLFRRTREQVGAATERRTALLRVRLADREVRMHRLLEAYTARVWREARDRGDARARLAAMVLKKRALSSAASLAVSCRRRLELLTAVTVPAAERQLMLPLGDEDVLEDAAPDSILAAPGLSNWARERRWLSTLVESASQAARCESKLRFLVRLLKRLREPVIVFTEYRDTLERLRLAVAQSHPDVQVLHGHLPAADRSAVQQAFNTAGSLLLATDAASEGLNLHSRCRVVIHYELPWSPARLEQRTGRVDRIGQRRNVHEIILVADDTAERLVLAPLARRAARARGALAGPDRLLELLTESRIAAAIMDGSPVDTDTPDDRGGQPATGSRDFSVEAAAEAARLRQRRIWSAGSARAGTDGRIAATLLDGRGVQRWTCVFTLSLLSKDGAVAHSETCVACVDDPTGGKAPAARAAPTAAAVRRLTREFIQREESRLHTAVRGRLALSAPRILEERAQAMRSLHRREQAIAAVPSTAHRLVQPGLFDQRAIRAHAAWLRSVGTLLEGGPPKVEPLDPADTLAAAVDLAAVLVPRMPVAP